MPENTDSPAEIRAQKAWVKELTHLKARRKAMLAVAREQDEALDDIPELKAEYDEDAVRMKELHKLLFATPMEHGSVDLSGGNYGVSFSVVDAGYGPTVRVGSSAFGNAVLEFSTHTTPSNLEKIGQMFLKAAKGQYTPAYVYAATVYESDNVIHTVAENQ